MADKELDNDMGGEIVKQTLDEPAESDYVPDNSDLSDDSDSAVEDQARALGWKPEDEYTGRPGKWTDAETFLEVHGKNNGALRRALDEQAKELKELRKEMKGLSAANQRIFDLQIKKAQEEHNQQIAFLKAQRKEARLAGDFETAEELENQLEAAQKQGPELPEIVEKQNTKQPNWRDDPILAKWADENPWFESDEDLNTFAGAKGVKLRQENPNMPFRELLDKVTSATIKAFPLKFATSARTVNRVEGATPGTTNAAAARNTYASLPKEAKVMCDEDVAAGNITQKKWVELYYSYDDRRKK